MVMPQQFREPRPFNPRLVTKTSLGKPKEAIALLVLLWLANDEPAVLKYGVDSDNGAMQLDEANIGAIVSYCKRNGISNMDKERCEELLKQNPLLSSQLEALNAAFELIWHLAEITFSDTRLNATAERTGGKRFNKTVAYSNNLDIISLLFEEDKRAFIEMLIHWLTSEQGTNQVLENRFIKLLAAFAEISFYKTGKGIESTIYLPQNVYEGLLNADEIELTDGAEAQGPTRILKSLIAQGLNPFLEKKGNNTVVIANGISKTKLQEYQKRARITLELSMVEVNRTDRGENPDAFDGELRQRNLIYFGAPGTGKSYRLAEDAKSNFDEDKINRVTFHPDYTYSQFVGSLRPHTEDGQVYYVFTPGPFIETYVSAQNDPEHDYLLIIEEINRANPAAVFGDVFQLLDRDSAGNSDYPVKTSNELLHYLDSNLLADSVEERERKASSLSLPSNMYIWATMNSADQGVFPMDTAFKRRWDFRYMGINDGEHVIADKNVKLSSGERINWNDLRKGINSILLDARVNEDKLLGPFFIDPDLLNDEDFNESFKNKVLLYLIEDAAKTKKEKVFDKSNVTYSIISEDFDVEGTRIFRDMRDIAIEADPDIEEEVSTDEIDD